METVNLVEDEEKGLQRVGIPRNYTVLISKFERLTFDLNSGMEDLVNIGYRDMKYKDNSSAEEVSGSRIFEEEISLVHRAANDIHQAEFDRVVSDAWVGVILTLLTVTVVFFVCSCFLYHKFKQWKNSYRANSTLETGDVIRRYDRDVESLPSYTIVSGLPTYDDALEQFRKAGIILHPQIPIVKIFDAENKEQLPPIGDRPPEYPSPDTIPSGTTYVCGNGTTTQSSQVIELSPEALAILSRKRLSLQISFNSLPGSVPRKVDLFREVSRNNLIRARRECELMPEIHRSTSMMLANEHLGGTYRLSNLDHHRGSVA